MSNKLPDSEMTSIPKREYEQLKEDSHFLGCLRSFGIDNWEGWDEAIALAKETHE